MSSVLLGPSRPPETAVAPAERRSREASRLWSAVSSRVYLPAAGVAALAAALIGIGWSEDWGGERFAGSLTDLRVVLVGPVALVIIGVFLVVERLWPAQPRPLFARGYRHDLLLTVINATLVAPLVTALTLSFMAVVRAGLPWIVLPTIGAIPRWSVIAIIVVAMDGLNWFVHLANHRVRMLWRFHELHHSQEDMSVLTVFRTHPLIHVSYLLALIPGIVLLANGAASITVLVIYGGIVAFAHSNTRLSFGPLGRVFVSPNYHRIHHQLNGPQDVNLGFALSIWDQIFHCAIFPSEATVRIDTGLPGRPLVVEQSTERPQHLSVLAAQLVAPFRPVRPSDLPPSSCRTSDLRDHSEGGASQGGDRPPPRSAVPARELASW
jgi:sterol desaturase/sphingolipid hydroxylase (fatty acid hydroxylase superfamily)